MRLPVRSIVLWGAVALLASHNVVAQDAPAAGFRQVVSANPFGLVAEFFNAELEKAATESSTAGVGGSYANYDSSRYLNADVFWRYYPQGKLFQGWSFGAKAGATHFSEEGTFFGYGFDLNRSWLLGKENNFYVGAGFGLKRLLRAPADFDPSVIPTIRIINVGFAF